MALVRGGPELPVVEHATLVVFHHATLMRVRADDTVWTPCGRRPERNTGTAHRRSRPVPRLYHVVEFEGTEDVDVTRLDPVTGGGYDAAKAP